MNVLFVLLGATRLKLSYQKESWNSMLWKVLLKKDLKKYNKVYYVYMMKETWNLECLLYE